MISDEMMKVMLSMQEIGAIELCLELVSNAYDRDELEALISDPELEELEQHCSNGTIDQLIELCKKFD